MTNLAEADRVEIHILVDNAVDGLSSTPLNVENEWAFATRRGLRASSDRCLCCGVHGLSCLVTVQRGDARHTLLFDSGPEEYAFERNTTRLGVDLGRVEGIVLSHGHWDHAGAMKLALQRIRAGNGGRAVPFHVHPGMFYQRGMKLPDGSVRQMDDVPSASDLAGLGAEILSTTEPQRLLDGLFHVSGEIPRVTPFERGLPGQVRRTAPDAPWESDELLMDERWIAVAVKGKGLVVLSACSHAGIVNVLSHARASFPGVKLHAVLGGLHLSGTNEKIIPETIAALKGFDLAQIGAGHCTGWRAMAALGEAFGDEVLAPSAVGKRYWF
jgi:7,8-dihydropterin-6-yl-methyl-4-(beta-D-ribofuranosyl)aminobenzene 5'-phosphate synthase